MKSTRLQFPLCKLAIAISSCLCSYSVLATPFLTVTATTTSGAYSDSQTIDNSNGAESIYASVNGSIASANTDGSFGVETKTNWESSNIIRTSSVSIVDTLTAEYDGTYSFDFTVNEGSVSALGYGYYSDEISTDTSSSYEVSILINDVLSWTTTASISNDGSNVLYTQTGENLSYNTVFNNAYSYELSWDEQDFSIALGDLTTGESIEIEYLVEAESILNFSSSGDSWGYGGSAVNFSDPYSLSGTPTFSSDSLTLVSASSTQSVPEPSSLLLFGAGVAGLAGSRRRKQKKNLSK